jgi:signal transduction histidine kinase
MRAQIKEKREVAKGTLLGRLSGESRRERKARRETDAAHDRLTEDLPCKHSDASLIEVSLETQNTRLLLSIRDDGVRGADPTRGSGLLGLADRVEALGGSIHIESRPSEGTQISAELPLELDVHTNAEQARA